MGSVLKGMMRIMIHPKVPATLPAMVLTLTSLVMAADSDINILKNSGSLDRLFKKTGVYNAASTGKTPSFVVDPCRAPPMRRVSRSMGSAKYARMAPSQIAAKPLLQFWSLIPTASCCAPGAVRPIPLSLAVNVRRRQAASGQLLSTVFTSTRTTTSGSREIPRRQGEEGRLGRRTRKAATALY